MTDPFGTARGGQTIGLINQESVMRIIAIIGMLAALLTTIAVTPASACPSGYHRCGGACCPR